MKRNILKILAAAALSAAIFSCQKEEGGSGMSIEEQYAYMDDTGDEALSQIEPDDFQRLADMINSLPEDSLDIEFDEASQARLALVLTGLMKIKGLVIDTDKINGTITIDGQQASFKTGKDKKLIYKTEDNTYTLTLDVTKGDKEVKLGNFKVEKTDVDVYLILPTDISVKVEDNAGLYCGGNAADIDCSAMPSDWSSLTLDDLDFSLTGGIFINGKGSYRAEATKLSIGNSEAEIDGSLYGREGKFLLSGLGSVKLTTDTTSISFYGNIIDRIISKSNPQGNADVYLNGSATPQFDINTSSGDVTFADGTVKTSEEVFNSTNMPKTYQSATDKMMQFAVMFGDYE